MTATQAQSAQAIATFVSNFHHDLTRWFSGADEGEATWNALVNAYPDNMTLIYPSGAQLSGRAFLEELASSKRNNGDFVASATEIRVLHAEKDLGVVAYQELQQGAEASQRSNLRSALALVRRGEQGWHWDYIQETGMKS